jgi:WD40 repeat protein
MEEVLEVDMSRPLSLAFSTSGRLFAAAGSNCTIELYDTITRKPLAWLRGHASTITGICWSDDDTQLFSCSSGGCVMQHAYLTLSSAFPLVACMHVQLPRTAE